MGDPGRRTDVFSSVEGRVGGILLADVVGFSRLPGDEEVLEFSRVFLTCVAGLLEDEETPPLTSNTWGDGLYLVFAEIRSTGLFALRLCRAIRDLDWGAAGLPEDMEIRVAVHAGPLYGFPDPVVGRPIWSGKHVVRAARMEPVTPPGTVYASREFAALAAAQRVREFTCEPVGRVPLAKEAGFSPVYVVLPDPSGSDLEGDGRGPGGRAGDTA